MNGQPGRSAVTNHWSGSASDTIASTPIALANVTPATAKAPARPRAAAQGKAAFKDRPGDEHHEGEHHDEEEAVLPDSDLVGERQ